MSAKHPQDFAHLSLSEQESVEAACDAFENAWKTGQQPIISHFLERLSHAVREVAIRELIILDLQYRWRKAAAQPGFQSPANSEASSTLHDDLPFRPVLDDYIAVLSEMRDTQISLDLIREEFRVRQLWGDRPAPIEYCRRFPKIPNLEAQLTVDFHELASADPNKLTVRNAGGPTPGAALRIRCPHCHSPVRLSVDAALVNIPCPACGSRFSLAEEDSDTRAAHKITTVGHFELLQRIGMGGFGSVWKARDSQLDRTVAVKIPRKGQLDQSEVEQFMREARTAAQLRHPHIVAVHEIGRDGDLVFIVSDLVRGVPLSEWATNRHPTPRESAQMCIMIAEALHHAHEAGVVHRDLKPHNVMVDQNDEPHLMDFGLARREVGDITVTLDGQVLGTPAYMSPEQARGEAHHVDRRTDVYSLGVMLFELLTGELPFRGSSRMVIYQVLHDESPSPRRLRAGVPLDLETICLKCLQKEAAQRYDSAQDVADELHRFCDGQPIAARPLSRMQKSWRWCQRRPVLASLFGVSAMLLLLITVISTSAAVVISRQRQQALEMASQQQQLVLQERAARDEAERKTTEANLARQQAEAISDYLVAAFRSPDPTRDGRSITVAEILQRATKQLDGQMMQDPNVRLRLLDAIGQSYFGLGQTAEAVEMLTRSFELSAETLGESDPWTLTVGNNLARALHLNGQFQDAAALLEDGHSRLQQSGDEHLALLLRTVDYLADVYLSQGRTAAAITLHEGNWEATREAFGDADPRTLGCMNNLASAYAQAGQYERAVPLFETALKGLRVASGEDHPDTLTTMNDLALVYENVGRFPEAQSLLERSLEVSRQKLGDDHPETLLTARNLAGFNLSLGRMSVAIPLLEQTHQRTRKKLGLDHPNSLNATHDLACAYRDVGRLEEAIALLEDTLQRSRDKLGDDHPDALKTMSNLGRAYGDAGRNDEAVQLLEDCLDKARDVFGADHPHVISLLGNLAGTHVKAGKLEEALPLVQEALQKCRVVMGKDHVRSLDATKFLASVYIGLGRYEEGLSLLEDTLPKIKAQLGSEHRRTLEAQLALANAYWHNDRQEEALRLLTPTLAQCRQVLGADHILTAKAIDQMADRYEAMGAFAEAVALVEPAWQHSQAANGDEHAQTIAWADRLARLRGLKNAKPSGDED